MRFLNRNVCLYLAVAFLAAAPAYAQEFRLGLEFNGAWHDPGIPGQGLIVASSPEGDFFFGGWFTYQAEIEERPGAHRWWTIEGEYVDETSPLDIYLTTAGGFTTTDPVFSSPVGTAHVSLEGCDRLVLEYDFDGGEAGTLALERLLPVPDSYCNPLLTHDVLQDIIEATTPLVLRDVVLVSMVEGEPLVGEEPTSVLVADGLIQEIGAFSDLHISPLAIVIDGRGRYLMPGLIDTHTHMAVNVREFLGYSTPGMLELVATNQLQLYLAHGVTTILNLGDFGSPQTRWAQEVQSGEKFGPTLYAAKYARGSVSSCDGGPPEVVVGISFEDGQAYVRQAVEEGYRYIKIYNCTPPDAVAGIVAEAKALDISVAGHLPSLVNSHALLLNEAFSLVAHSNAFLWNGYLRLSSGNGERDKVVSAMLDGQVAVSSTLWINEKLAQVWCLDQSGIDQYWAESPLDLMHSTEIKLHERSIQGGRFAPQGCAPGDFDGDLAFSRDMVKRFGEAGGQVLAGTDSPTVLGVAGISMHDELLALQRAGLSLEESFAAATRSPGNYVGRTLNDEKPLGQVAPGFGADLLLLDRPPEQAVKDFFESIELVIAQGGAYPRAVREDWLERIREEYAE